MSRRRAMLAAGALAWLLSVPADAAKGPFGNFAA
jgi:hypothetical protein